MDAAAAAQPVPWPDAPTQVTDLETAANVLSMQERAVRSILRDINDGGDETQEKYAGDDTSQSFRRWERALLQTADGMQLTDIKFWALHAQAANWTEEDWNRLYSRSDRQFIYRVLMSTLTRTAMEAAERADQNGMLVYRFFHNLWGASTVANSITALKTIVSTRVARNDDPTPAIKQMDKLIADFFPDCGNNIKIALLILMIDTNKYKQATADLEKPGGTEYTAFRDKVIRIYYRERAEYNAKHAERPNAHATTPGNTTPGDQGTTRQKRKSYCKFCKRHVMHKERDCFTSRGGV